MAKICCIYKIVSPSGKIYIGQSVDFESRKSQYRLGHCKNQVHITASINKYGFKNHVFEILHQLPPDVGILILNQYEQLYMDLYRECGFQLMNIREAGCTGKLGLETKEKMSKSKKGQRAWNKGVTPSAETRAKIKAAMKNRLPASEETRLKISKALKNRVFSNEHREKISQTLIGHKRSYDSRLRQSIAAKGKPRGPKSEESKRKQSIKMKGRILSKEHKAAISKGLQGRVAKPHTEETKERLSFLAKIQIRKPCSEEQKQKIAIANTGKVRTLEMRKKISASLKLYNEKRRQNAV